MNEQKLFLNYLKGLLKQWYFTVTLIVGAIDIFIRPFFDIPIPWWFFLGLFGLAFIAANYQLYRQTQQQIRQFREQHQHQLAQAQTEVNELRNREPRLDLRFADNNTKRAVLKVLNPPEPINVELLVQQEAKSLEQTYDNLGNSNASSSGGDPFGIGSSLDIIRHIGSQLHGPLKSKNEYDEDCKEYLQKYRHFLFERATHANYLARYRTLKIEVENTGTRPASDIVVIIDFPDEFHFPTTREEQNLLPLLSREPPKPPTKPSLYRPSPFSSIGLSPDFLSPRIYNDLSGLDLGKSNVSGPFIKPKNSTEVSYEIGQLMHNFIEELEPAGFYLTEAAIGHALELTYSLHAAELMRPIEGSLIVAIELSQEG